MYEANAFRQFYEIIHINDTADAKLKLPVFLCNCQTGCQLPPTTSSCGFRNHQDVNLSDKLQDIFRVYVEYFNLDI